jgi:DNA-nicking Smr family endonuclease
MVRYAPNLRLLIGKIYKKYKKLDKICNSPINMDNKIRNREHIPQTKPNEKKRKVVQNEMNLDMNKLNFLFKKEWLDRITIGKEENKITIDLHYLTCKEAEKLVKNTIALTKGEYTMDLIHGYNNGTAIKQLIHNEKLSDRVQKKICPQWNPGLTELLIAA